MTKRTEGAEKPRTGEQRLVAYLDGITSVLGQARRAAAARAYCTGLLLPGERKSVEPMAARLEGAGAGPAPVAAPRRGPGRVGRRGAAAGGA